MSNATTSETSGAGVLSGDDDNLLNDILQITTWILLALTSLMMCFRLLTRYFLRKHDILHDWDDILLLLSYILAVGKIVIWILPQTSTVFGREQQPLAPNRDVVIETGLKAMYASDILLLLSLGLAKLSVCACYLRLVPASDVFHRRWSQLTAAVVVLWTVAFTLAAAFRCGMRPWWGLRGSGEGGDVVCLDQHAFLTSTSITNIITDLGLVAIPISLVTPMSLPLRTRLTTVLVFSARSLIIIPCAFQLFYLARKSSQWETLLLFDDGDGLPIIGKYVIATQAVQFAGIAAACIIYLSPLLQSLGSGGRRALTVTMASEGGLVSGSPRKRSAQDLLGSGES